MLQFNQVLVSSIVCLCVLHFGAIVGLGNHTVYIIFLAVGLQNILLGGRLQFFSKKLVSLVIIIGFFLLYSAIFAANFFSQIIYSFLYLFIIMTVFFAYYYPAKALRLLFCVILSLAIFVLTGLIAFKSTTEFLILGGYDPNFIGFFLVCGIFILGKFKPFSVGVRYTLLILLILVGLLLGSRSFVLCLLIVSASFIWEYNRLSKFFLTVGLIFIAIASYRFALANLPLIDAIWSAMNGRIVVTELVSDIRRIGLLATGFAYVYESFPYGSGLGPTNYILGVLNAGLVQSESLRLGYPHNYFLSAIAQGGAAGVVFLILLLSIAFKSLKEFPIICALLVGIGFNEYIGIPALWVMIGLFFNKRGCSRTV